MTKEFFQGPNKAQAKYVLKLGRLDLARFIKLITGHNGLFYFKSKIDPVISPLCRFCLEQNETFYHLLHDCPRHRNNRQLIFLDEIPDFNTNWSVRALLSFSKLTGIRDALDGDTSIRWYDEWTYEEEDEMENPEKRQRLDDNDLSLIHI